jgi:hypothetical protein
MHSPVANVGLFCNRLTGPTACKRRKEEAMLTIAPRVAAYSHPSVPVAAAMRHVAFQEREETFTLSVRLFAARQEAFFTVKVF